MRHGDHRHADAAGPWRAARNRRRRVRPHGERGVRSAAGRRRRRAAPRARPARSTSSQTTAIRTVRATSSAPRWPPHRRMERPHARRRAPASIARAAGYVGADAFTYTATGANGDTKTATVHVTVDAPSAAQPAVATDDDVATLAPSSVAFDVLANDRGTGTLSVQSSQAREPRDRDVCSERCLHLRAGGGLQRPRRLRRTCCATTAGEVDTAAVHIAVAPAGSTLALTASGSPDAPSRAASSAPVDMRAGRRPSRRARPGSRATSCERSRARRSRRRSAARTPSSPVRRPWRPGSVPAAPPAPARSSAARSAGPSPGPCLRSARAPRRRPRPDPRRLGGLRVLPPRDAADVCVHRPRDGTRLPGYPEQLNVGSIDINGPAVVHGSKIWWHALLGNGSFRAVRVDRLVLLTRRSTARAGWRSPIASRRRSSVAARTRAGSGQDVVRDPQPAVLPRAVHRRAVRDALAAPRPEPGIHLHVDAVPDPVRRHRHARSARLRLRQRLGDRVHGRRRAGAVQRMVESEELRRRVEPGQPARCRRRGDRRLRRAAVGRHRPVRGRRDTRRPRARSATGRPASARTTPSRRRRPALARSLPVTAAGLGLLRLDRPKPLQRRRLRRRAAGSTATSAARRCRSATARRSTARASSHWRPRRGVHDRPRRAPRPARA